MKSHERHCTANPNRECRMCKMVGGIQKPLAELVAVFDGWQGDDPLESLSEGPDAKARIARLEELTDGCPACMLTAARAVMARHKDGETDHMYCLDVEFKRRCREL